MTKEIDNNRGQQSRRRPSRNKPAASNENTANRERTSNPKQQNPNQKPQQQQQQQRRYFKPNKNKDRILSVVIPCYNEAESLPELTLQLEAELDKITRGKYEVIFVDDGSTDNTLEVIRTINQRNRRFRAVSFRRNYGKSAALSVGFEEAKGVLIVTMDADLQDDPTEIQQMIDKLKEGYDLVTGWKKKRYDPITKTLPSRFFNFVTSRVSGLKLHDFNCGLKVYKEEVVKNIQVYGELHRYIPALAKFEGFKVAEVPVKHHPRRYGKSKYGFSRLIKGGLDLLTMIFTTRYLKRPLHFFGTIGSVVGISGFLIDLWLLIEWFMDKTSLSNRPLVLLGMLLIIVGVQLVSFGLIGEMLVKNNIDNKKYQISDRI